MKSGRGGLSGVECGAAAAQRRASRECASLICPAAAGFATDRCEGGDGRAAAVEDGSGDGTGATRGVRGRQRMTWEPLHLHLSVRSPPAHSALQLEQARPVT